MAAFKNVLKAFALSIATALPAMAQDQPELRITTGSSSGTYYRFAFEIKQALPDSLPLHIEESGGSVQNLRRLLGYEGASEGQFYQLAMVQADVLEQLRQDAESNPTLKDIVSRIKVVLPLYREEIHVFANQNVQSGNLAEALDTQDLLIGSGNEGSGTFLTTTMILEQLGHEKLIGSLFNVDGAKAIEDLTSESIDVLFNVAGAPSSLGQSIPESANLKLLSIPSSSFRSDADSPYRAAQITPTDYPWMRERVETMSVLALLVAFDYPEDNPYCDQIRRLTESIIDNLELLRSTAHEKWKDVDLVKAKQRSDLYNCSKDALYKG